MKMMEEKQSYYIFIKMSICAPMPREGRKQLYNPDIFQERFRTIERLFVWEDKFKRLSLRFEHKSKNFDGFKILAYTMINLRHFIFLV